MARFDSRQLAAWSDGSWRNGIPQVGDGVSIDSRHLARGNIFIAIPGPNFDGHDFISAAFRQGASGAVVARPDLVSAGYGPLLVVNDTARALQQIAANYRRTLDIKMIAVTGSVGKTTVKEMIAGVLNRQLTTAKTIGNWNNEYGLPLSILNMDARARVGVFELGVSRSGELDLLCRLLKPDWGVITAVGPVHLQFFGSVKAVADEKSVLLKNLPKKGVAFLGRDDCWFDFLRASADCRVVSVGARNDADYVLVESDNAAGQARVREKASGDLFDFRPPLPGNYIVADILFAIAVARTHGCDWSVIRAGIENYRPQAMRWESETIAGILTINDAYNANPVSMEAALQTFATMKSTGRKWLVLAGMHELGSTEEGAHQKLGSLVAGLDLAGLITVGRLGETVAAAAGKNGMKPANIFRCGDHQAAAENLAVLARPGDAVLFKASRCERLEKVLEIWKRIKEPQSK